MASACRRSEGPPPQVPSVRTRRLSQRTRKGPAIEQDVLAGDEAGLGAAQERAGKAELLGIAEAPGRIELGTLRQNLLHGETALLRLALGRTAKSVGFERPRQQAVDRNIVDHGLAGEAGDKARQPGARAVG